MHITFLTRNVDISIFMNIVFFSSSRSLQSWLFTYFYTKSISLCHIQRTNLKNSFIQCQTILKSKPMTRTHQRMRRIMKPNMKSLTPAACSCLLSMRIAEERVRFQAAWSAHQWNIAAKIWLWRSSVESEASLAFIMEAPHRDVSPKRVTIPLVAKCSMLIVNVKAIKSG